MLFHSFLQSAVLKAISEGIWTTFFHEAHLDTNPIFNFLKYETLTYGTAMSGKPVT